jgi:carboxyl-terminal processing protease
MVRSSSRLKILIKRITWLTAPLLVATLLVLQVRPDPPVSAESIPPQDTKVITRALHFIEKNYVDPQAIDPRRMLKLTSKELERSIAPLIVKEREKGLEVTMGEKKTSLPLSNPLQLDDLPPLLGRLLGFLDLFYQGRLDDRERLWLAMNGLAESLDPHSNYLPPKIYNEFKIGTKGNFGGLGIVIGIRDTELTVIAPLEGTPAFEAGIKAKDKIVQIGEESTINMGLTEAVEKLRGPVGSRVSLVINRAGIAAPLKFTLTRALIRIQSVAGRLLDKKIALLKVKNFQEDTMEQFRKTLRGFHAEGAKIEGLILDLRNNPGGLLDQAIAVADFFLRKGTIVKTVGPHGETIDLEEAEEGDEGEGLPVVVLVNEGSASASEIVAGALQFNDRALVVGNRTFGKGSVQTVYDLKDGSALKLTIAKYLTARDQPVQSIGINPDIGLLAATIEEREKGEKRVDLFEDVKRRELDLEEESEEEQKQADLPPPLLQMTYLAPEKKEEEETGKIELKDDFPVHLAERILLLPEGESLNRQAVLKAIPNLLAQLETTEKGKIRMAMEKVGVDWSASEEDKKGKPSGTVTVEILDENDRPREGLFAGESGFLKVTVFNKGNAPYYQLAAVTKSKDPLFANLEFPFGKVAPQEKKEWKTPLKMPDFVHRRSIPVELEFHEHDGRLPKSSPFSMQIEEPPSPLFEYSYTIVDSGVQGTSGNGNRRVERGETIGLQVKVKNIGKGESRSAVVSLKNLEGEQAFIEKGRVDLARIPAGGEAEALLRFRVPRGGEGNKLSFDLAILDSHLGEELNDRIVLPLTADSPTPPPETVQAPPVIELFPETPPLISQGGSYLLKGTAKDDQELKHLFLFVGDEKVLYQTPPHKDKSFSFETNLSLKKGANLITVAAQDDRELTTRKQWIVWRNK